MTRTATKGRSAKVDAVARRQRAIPLLLEGKSHREIAAAIGVSASTVKRYADHPDTKAELERLRASVSASTEALATRLVRASWTCIEGILGDLDTDARTRLEAAKTALDRLGHPATSKSEASHDVRGAAGVQVVISDSLEAIRATATGRAAHDAAARGERRATGVDGAEGDDDR